MKGNKNLWVHSSRGFIKCIICGKELETSTGNICKKCEEEWDDKSGGEIYTGTIELKNIKKAEAKT